MPNLPRGVTHRCSEDLFLALTTRSIYIFESFTMETAGWVVPWLHRLDKTEAKAPICVYVSSEGGCYYAGQVILDTVSTLKCPVRVIGTGFVASAAADLVALSPVGSRYATANTIFMLHQASLDMSASDPEVLRSNASFELKRADDDIKKLAKRFDMAWKDLKDKLTKEWILTSRDALKYNVIDGIVK